jgi:hypothetical protein
MVCLSFLTTINVSEKSCRVDQNKHFMFCKHFFLENRAVYEIVWNNMAQSDRSQMTIQYGAGKM